MRSRVLLACALLLACAAAAGVARADGDPASDTLAFQNVYLPYETPSPTASAALTRAISSAYAAGYRVKVAVIAGKSDLGSIPSLYGKPANYAAFLGQELSTAYIGPLLVVMPAGYGIYDGSRSVAAEQAILGRLSPPSSERPDDLVQAATTAVHSMLEAGALESKDVLRPFVSLVSGSYARGRLTIQYYAYDDSGRARLEVTATRAGRSLFRASIRSHTASFSTVLRRTLRLPGRVSLARARLCLSATDAAGNRSTVSCRRVSG